MSSKAHTGQSTKKLNVETIANNPKLRGILLNNRSAFFKSVEAMKDKERLRNCHRWEETTEAQ